MPDKTPDPMYIQERRLQAPAKEKEVGEKIFRIGRQQGGDCSILCENRDIDKPEAAFEEVPLEVVPNCVLGLMPAHSRRY